MDLALLRLLVDFGMVIVLLLVQLVIYPSFTKMSAADLKNWHPAYTKRVSIIILPLMLSQAVIVIFQIIQFFSYVNLVSLLLVFALWALTFLQAVPLHSKIDQTPDPMEAAHKLVAANRIRLFLWLLLFIFSLSTWI